ncbi:hypothetical protein PHYBOEH_007561 [Phytophthora boehmeriae]|uniref:Uncharacterized protein n=1 Tax=Phytophthora boehmeriae TaxID=109152 RepID=A0A8T1W790_9STRA|nr:hypothetical protein PHYBOEH_007561 [Phytophthora boehmeriae]
MPLLKRLLRAEELGDAPQDATAEQLFASSIHLKDLRMQRRLAAALCSAPLVNMAAISTAETEQISVLGEGVSGARSITDCVTTALMIAKEGWQVLFLMSDSKMITKRLAAAVSRPEAGLSTESAAECLHSRDNCVEMKQEKPEQGSDARTRLVAIGPLCDLLSPFQTATGLTTSGTKLMNHASWKIQIGFV